VDVGALVGEAELDHHPLEQPERLLDALRPVGDIDDLVDPEWTCRATGGASIVCS
jgi:hypothetical protein